MDVLSTLGNQRLYEITGHSAPFIFPLSRYLWFRKHGAAPVAHLLMINDWITYRLSGELSAEPSNATESMLFDLRGRCWADEILSAFDIPAAILPPVRRSGERVGTLTKNAAVATGLAAGTPVFVGGADTQCSLLGAGAIAAHATAATLGTTAPVQTVLEQAAFDPQATLWAGCHVIPDRWVLESNAGDTGDAYLWLLDLVGDGRPRGALFELGEQLAAGRFGPPMMASVGPTVFNLTKMRLSRPGGFLFPFPSLHVRPDRGTFIRAFLENVAYALRANLEQLMAVTGEPVAELIVSGGMSRSRVLVQVIADVGGRPVRVARQPESAALGCAMLIMANSGGRGFAAAVHDMVRHDSVEPDAEMHERYEAPYRKWRQLYDAMDELEV
jgi:autoinducer 2 (AI-2) kinase